MANRWKRRLSEISLKTQLIVSFVAVTLVVLSVNTYYNYSQTLEIQQHRTRDMTLAQFRQIETNISTLLDEVDKLSNTFLLESEVRPFVDSENLTNPDFIPLQHEITKLMFRYWVNYDYLDSLYLFSSTGMVIGGTLTQNQSSTVVGKEYPFFYHPLYDAAIKNYPERIWGGAVTSKEFMRIPLANAAKNNYLISALKVAKSKSSVQLNSVLVVNIKERYLNSFYDDLKSGETGSLHIVDDTGTVISSTMADSIGETYRFNEQIAADGAQFGSFSAARDDSPEQVLYFRMDEPGWILIDEVPMDIYVKDTVAIQRFTAAVFVLSIILITALSSLWMHRIMRSLQSLAKGMRHVGRGNVGLVLPRASSKEIRQITEQFNRMSTGILELMAQNEEAEKNKRRLEIEALQSQINPHFLFNTLNTMKWMAAVSGATNIMDCITNLGNMLRPIYKQPSLMWSIEEEITFVKSYANIMNYRYGEEVGFDYDVPESLGQCQTLRFIIQPLIENALIHGKANKGVIRIVVGEADGDIVLRVADTRGGMPQERVDELNRVIQLQDSGDGLRGIGLLNVNKRLQLHFGDKYGLFVESIEGTGTSVTVKIPVIQAGESVQNS